MNAFRRDVGYNYEVFEILIFVALKFNIVEKVCYATTTFNDGFISRRTNLFHSSYLQYLVIFFEAFTSCRFLRS